MAELNITNRSLSMLLLGVIVVSLFGTLMILNKSSTSGVTGFAPTGTGVVNLSVTESVSITTADGNLIDFGACITNDVNLTISSHTTTPNCSLQDATNEIENLSVRNDGNVQVNVTMLPSKVGEANGGNFLDSPDGGSAIAYKVANDSRHATSNGGCYTTFQSTYANLTSNTTPVLLCGNLTSGVNNSIMIDFQLFIPKSVVSGNQTNSMLFTATKRI